MVCVLPGVDEVFANPFLPVSILMSEDFPTLDLPIKANSGNPSEGQFFSKTKLPVKVADLMIILIEVAVKKSKE